MGLGQPASESRPAQTYPSSARDSVLTLTDANAGAGRSWLGTRSFVMYGGGRYDYLTQQPAEPPSSWSQSSYPPPAAEFMFGGGLSHGEMAEGVIMKDVGVADDRSWSLDTGAYLGGALSVYFGGWGAEGRDAEGKSSSPAADETEEGRVKKLWTGIMGISADGQPWVGRLPVKITGRPAPGTKFSSKNKPDALQLAAPGEWIAAGYSGEGMVNAYLSGKALAHMVLELGADDGLPDAFLVTEGRWKKANIEDLVSAFVV